MSASVVADNVRIWLHTKLERPWNGSHVAYHLTNDVLALVVDQWISLDTTVKLRLLAALLAVKPAQLRSTLTQTQQIIALTAEDSDGWVQTVGQIISSALVPENAHFDLSALESNPETSTVIQNLQKIIKDDKEAEFAPLIECYLEKPKFIPKPNIHFTVKKPQARAPKPKDLTASTSLTGSGAISRPAMTASNGIRNSSGNVLSSSSILSSGTSSSILSSSNSGSKYSGSILSQGSRFENRRPFPGPAASANSGIVIVDQVQVEREKKQKEEEAKAKAEAEKKAKRESKKKTAQEKKNLHKPPEIADIASDQGAKKKKTTETHNPTAPHVSIPNKADDHGDYGMNALMSAASAMASTDASKAQKPQIAPAPLTGLQVTSHSTLPQYSATQVPVSSFNNKPSAPTGLSSLLSKPPSLSSGPPPAAAAGTPKVAPAPAPASSTTKADAELLLVINPDNSRTPPVGLAPTFASSTSASTTTFPRIPTLPTGYQPLASAIPTIPNFISSTFPMQSMHLPTGPPPTMPSLASYPPNMFSAKVPSMPPAFAPNFLQGTTTFPPSMPNFAMKPTIPTTLAQQPSQPAANKGQQPHTK